MQLRARTMESSNIPKIISWWVTPKLPKEHVFIKPKDRPKGIMDIVRVYFIKWLIHPIKRRLAKYYLIFLKRFFGLKVIAITGSAGKTSTKEMVASILRICGSTVSSYANIDPIYNIPTTILRCSSKTKYLVLEMGVEYPGEMDYYLWLITPDIGAITNIYPTHTEFLGDIRGVFKEKSKLAKSLSVDSVFILNSEDPWLVKLKDKIKARVVSFGSGTEVAFSNERINKDYKTQFILTFDQNQDKQVEITLPVFGKQFIVSALCASAIGKALGISLETIKKGLAGFSVPEHRMTLLKHKSGALILDDSYNNNPAAAKAAVNTLKEFKGARKIIVFGDMLELGDWEKKYHLEIGEAIGKIHPDKLICIGHASFNTATSAAKIIGEERVVSFSSWQEALPEIKKELKPGTTILIKGSRSIGLDKLVSALF